MKQLTLLTAFLLTSCTASQLNFEDLEASLTNTVTAGQEYVQTVQSNTQALTNDAKQRVAKIQEGLQKIEEGKKLIQEGLTGTEE